MHKLKQLSASSFLRLLFAAFTFAFFCSAFIAPDRAEMFTGAPHHDGVLEGLDQLF